MWPAMAEHRLHEIEIEFYKPVIAWPVNSFEIPSPPNKRKKRIWVCECGYGHNLHRYGVGMEAKQQLLEEHIKAWADD